MKKFNLLPLSLIFGLFFFGFGNLYSQGANIFSTHGGMIVDDEDDGSGDLCVKKYKITALMANINDQNWPLDHPAYIKLVAFGQVTYLPLVDYYKVDIPKYDIFGFDHIISIHYSDVCGIGDGTLTFPYTITLVQSVNGSYIDFPYGDHSGPNDLFPCELFETDCDIYGCDCIDGKNDFIYEGNFTFNCKEAEAYCQETKEGSTKGGAKRSKDRSTSIYLTAVQDIAISPNPTSDFTNLTYTLSHDGDVNYTIFDTQGKVTYTDRQNENAGDHQKYWDTSSWTPGVYWVQIKTGQQVETLRLLKF